MKRSLLGRLAESKERLGDEEGGGSIGAWMDD